MSDHSLPLTPSTPLLYTHTHFLSLILSHHTLPDFTRRGSNADVCLDGCFGTPIYTGAAHLEGLQGGAMGGPETYLDNFTHALVATVKHYAGEYRAPI